MTRTLNITGMKCAHCEKRTKNALEALPQIDEAIVSAANNNAVVTVNGVLDEAEIRKTVTDLGFDYIGMN